MGERVEASKLRAEIHEAEGVADRIADAMIDRAFSWPSFIGHVIWFGVWLALRLDINLLTMVVSLEAIFLCVVIGLSQKRQAAKDHKRDDQEASEVDLLYEINRQQIEILEELRVHLTATGRRPARDAATGRYKRKAEEEAA